MPSHSLSWSGEYIVNVTFGTFPHFASNRVLKLAYIYVGDYKYLSA